jgi:hypothetical protein
LPYKFYVIPDDCGCGVIDTVKKEDKPIVPFNMERINIKITKLLKWKESMANYVLMTTCKSRIKKYPEEVQDAITSIARHVDKVFVVISIDEFGDEVPHLKNCVIIKMKQNLYTFKKFVALKAFEFDPEDNIFLVETGAIIDYVPFMLLKLGDGEVASLGNSGCIGAFTVFKCKAIKDDFFGYWNKTLIAAHIGDCYMTDCFKWKGYKTTYCNECVDQLRTVAHPLIPESANNPDNSVCPKIFS